MMSAAGRLTMAAVAAFVLIAAPMPASATVDPIDAVTSAVGRAAEQVRIAVMTLLGRPPEETVTPPTPSDVLHNIEGGTGHSQFWDYLKDAGYDLREIETAIGIIPDIKITFQLVRELSEADRDWLQQELDVDALRRRGISAKIQRRIVQTLLDASEFQDLRVAKLVIGILPLPSADFVVEPANAPLSEEHDTIYRALLNKSGRRTSVKPSEDELPSAPR